MLAKTGRIWHDYIMNMEQKSFSPGGGSQAAGFGPRALAYCLDMFTVLLLSLGLACFAGATLFRLAAGDIRSVVAVSLLAPLAALLLPPLVSMFYFTVFHAVGGQTIGKMLLGLRVVSETGGPLSVGAAFLRWAAQIVSALPLGAGFFWAAVDRKRCAWHDHLSCSRVLGARNRLTTI